jgi:chromosome segregation ATPase
MNLHYGLSQDLQDLAGEAERLVSHTTQLEDRVAELEEELKELSGTYQELIDYIDGVDENIMAAFEAQRKLA